MIESRYKIEYVLPDEDVKKSSPFKVLWYFLLIPLVLFAKQEQQLKEFQEQLEKNKKLAQSLNSLSSELVLEKTRNDSLNSKLSEQEKDRLELEEQLNKALAEFEKNKKQVELVVEQQEKKVIEPVVVQPIIESKPESKEIETIKTVIIKPIQKEVEVVITEESPEIKKELIKTETPVITKSEENKEEKELSATDKIIAAMSSNNTEKVQEVAEQEKLEVEQVSKQETDNIQEVIEETTEKENDIVFSLGVKNSEELKIDDSSTTSSMTETQEKEKNEDQQKVNIEVVTEKPTIKEDTAISKIPDNKVDTQNQPTTAEAPKTVSPVDAIIAAMEQTQATSTTSPEQNIDPELEKEICN